MYTRMRPRPYAGAYAYIHTRRGACAGACALVCIMRVCAQGCVYVCKGAVVFSVDCGQMS